MFSQWLRRRREAKMRAADYAVYYLNREGDSAESCVAAEFSGHARFSYRGMLRRYILRELRRKRAAPLRPARGRRRSG